MTQMLIFKEKLKNIYSSYSVYIDPAIRFVLTFSFLLLVNHYFDYAGIFSNPVVAVLVSMICCLLPINFSVLVTAFFVIVNVYYINPIMALIVLMIYLVMFIMYFRFSAKYGYILMLMPIMFFLKIPYIIPIVIGILMIPSAIFAMIFGIIIHFILLITGNDGVVLVNGTSVSSSDKVSLFIKNIASNKEMIIYIVAFTVTAVVAYLIAKLSINYAKDIAIMVSGILNFAIIITLSLVTDLDLSSSIIVIGLCIAISVGITYLLSKMILALDYQRTEFVQYEDDNYYYYVKAIPKVKVSAESVQVQHINVKRNRRR